MNTPGKARMVIKVVSALVFSAGMLAGWSGAASAQAGLADFCGAATYDNNSPQTSGLFTDLRRGGGINLDADHCVLNITGSTGSAGDMWITLVDPPDDATPPPTFDCVLMNATVVIHKFNNRKAIGFVTNFQPGVDPGSGTGLFLGLYDNGNTDAVTLSAFDAATGQLTSTVATLPLGSKIKEDAVYSLVATVCTDGTELEVQAVVVDSTWTWLEIQTPEGTLLPAGIAASGQIGLAGQATSALVDSGVVDFFVWARSINNRIADCLEPLRASGPSPAPVTTCGTGPALTRRPAGDSPCAISIVFWPSSLARSSTAMPAIAEKPGVAGAPYSTHTEPQSWTAC